MGTNTATAVIVDSFLPPETTWGAVPVLPMDLDGASAMVQCSDGAQLAVLHLSAPDVLKAIQGGTLFDKAAKLKQRSPWAYMIISGELRQRGSDTLCDGSLRKWQWSSVEGALLTVQELGVVVATCPHEADLGARALQLASRDRSTKRVSATRDLGYYSPGEALLLALPGIGEARAYEVLAHVGNVPWVALWALTDSTPLPGIGDGIKARIREALGLGPDEALGVIQHGGKPATAKKDAA